MVNDKWNTIEWMGTLIFPKEYESQKYNTKGIGPFEKDLEEMLYHFASKLDTEYMGNPLFTKNFYNSIKSFLPVAYSKKEFPKDFMPYLDLIKKDIETKKLTKVSLSAKENKAKKAELDKMKADNGFVMHDGVKQPLGTYCIEPPGILITRGTDKRIGSWKARTYPEDVIINATKGKAPVAPEGHKWKAVVENKKALWCATYFVKIKGFDDLPKKILFGATSTLTKGNEQIKYEKARKLILKWEDIQKHIFDSFRSKDKKFQLTAMVVYLVQLTGCRIGNDKDLEVVADTVGVSTLRKEHISLKGNMLTLEFFGKDSVMYKNTIEVCSQASTILKELLDSKKDSDEVFAEVSSVDATAFLRVIVKDASIKTFRTAYGTKLLCEELQKLDFSEPTLTITQKLHMYDLCTLEVAKKLNHKKTPPKNFDEKTETLNSRLEMEKENAKELEKKLSSDMKDLLKQITIAKETFSGVQLKKSLEKFAEKKEKLSLRLASVKTSLEQKETKLKFRADTKEIAIGTSRSSYSSPRIAYSWCKDTGVPIEMIYSKTAIGKMDWASDTPVSYYKKFPNVKAS